MYLDETVKWEKKELSIILPEKKMQLRPHTQSTHPKSVIYIVRAL